MSTSSIIPAGLAVVGAIIGGFVTQSPYGAMQGAAWGYTLGSAISATLAEKPKTAEPSFNDSLDGNGDEGVVIPRCYGRGIVGTNCIWATAIDRDQETRNGNRRVSYKRNVAIAFCQGPIHEFLALFSGSDKIPREGSVHLGTESQVSDDRIWQNDLAVYENKVPAFKGIAYTVLLELDMAQVKGQLSNIRAEITTTSTGTVPLSTVVLNEVALVGIQPNEIDVTELVNIQVKWFSVDILTSVKDILATLQSVYWFDIKDSGEKLVCQLKVKHQTSVATIPVEDLIRVDPDGESSLVIVTQIPDREIPYKVSVRYLDEKLPYDKKVKSAIRVDVDSHETRNIDINARLSSTEAQNVANRILTQLWDEKYKISFSVSYKYLWLEPCDIVTVNTVDRSYRVYITKISYSPYTNINVDGVIYPGSSVITLPSGETEWLDTEMLGGGTDWVFVEKEAVDPILILMDLPVIEANLTTPNMQVGCYTEADEYADDVTLYRGEDIGTLEVVATGGPKTVCGTTLTALGNGRSTYWDEFNKVRFNLIQGSLLGSVSRDTLYKSVIKRLWLVGNELIQARRETFIGGTTWELSDLLRGRRGTEWATGGHVVGEYVVLLEDEERFKVLMPNVQTIDYWLGTNDDIEDPVTSGAVSKLYEGNVVAHFSPANLTVINDGTKVILSWVWRNRLILKWLSYSDIPREPDFLGYKVVATQGSVTYEEVVGTEGWEMTVIDMEAMGFSTMFPITFSVCSLGMYREGIPATVTL